MSARVLVTGGAGYVGSHVCKALARAGHLPVTIDNLREGHRWAVRWGPLIVGDLRDLDLVRRAIAAHRISAVMHFAACAYVGESMHAPGRYFQNNVVASLGLLDVMVETGVSTLVFSSSCAVYGVPQALPVDESHPLQPVSPYGESKLFVERALHWYGAAHGVCAVRLRYFNAAGADPEGELGEAHAPETHLIPRVLRAALERGRIEIYGTRYPTPDGTAVRDYVHVTDLAAAHVLALEHLRAGRDGGAFNLGSGRGHSVREVIDAVGRAVRRRVTTRALAPRPGDPPMLVADAARAGKVLNWQPRHSDLATVVGTALRWARRGQPAARGRRNPGASERRNRAAGRSDSRALAQRAPTADRTT